MICPITFRTAASYHTQMTHSSFTQSLSLNYLPYSLQLNRHSSKLGNISSGMGLSKCQKTPYIFLGTHQLIPRTPDNTTTTFRDTTIKPSSHVRNLGVYFDNYMNFDFHINEISTIITGTLVYITRVKHCFDKETRIIIIQSPVLSILNYCNTAWGTTNTTLLAKTQKLQNFAFKVADGNARKHDHVTPIFRRMEWLNIMKTIQLNTAVTAYKQLNNYCPQSITDLHTVNTLTGSVTRQQNTLFVPRVVTQSGSRSLCARSLTMESPP